MCEQASKLTELGATDREVAEFFDISESTLYLWKHTHPEFSEALTLGKKASDDRVVKSLYRRATGYSFDAVKITTRSIGENQGSVIERVPYVEHVPPDTTACIFWLKNRRPDLWRDRQSHELTGADGGPILTEELSRMTPEERNQRLAHVLSNAVRGTNG